MVANARRRKRCWVMNGIEPWRVIAETLAPSSSNQITTHLDDARPPIARGRWYVLFSKKQRSLLVPTSSQLAQDRCLKFFITNRWKLLYAKIVLKANSILRGMHLLPTVRLRSPEQVRLLDDLPFGAKSHSAILVGTPGPYQKASVLLVSGEGETMALAKIAMRPTADGAVHAEVHWLRELAAFDNLGNRVPRLLAEGVGSSGRPYLVTTLARGERTTRSFTQAHAAFLSALGHTHLITATFAESPAFQYLERTFSQLKPHIRDRLAQILECSICDCRVRLRGWSGPFVVSQGDFAPWNIRLQPDGIFVFDWEYTRRGANPLQDAFHFYLIQRAVHGRYITPNYFTYVKNRVRGFALSAYPEWDWEPGVVSGLALAYLLDVLLYYAASINQINPQSKVIRVYWQLIEKRGSWIK